MAGRMNESVGERMMGKRNRMTNGGFQGEENSRGKISLQLIVGDWTRRGRYLRLLLGEARLLCVVSDSESTYQLTLRPRFISRTHATGNRRRIVIIRISPLERPASSSVRLTQATCSPARRGMLPYISQSHES